MRVEKKITLVFLSFLLAVFVTVLGYVIGLKFGMLSEKTVLNAMSDSGYYEGVLKTTIEEVQDIIIPMGLSNSVLEEVFTEEQIEKDAKVVFEQQTGVSKEIVDVTYIGEKLNENIKKYMSQNGIVLDDEQNSNIGTFIDAVISIYVNNISIPFVQYYQSISQMFSKYMYYGLGIMAVFIIIAVFLIEKVCGSSSTNVVRYVAYAVIAAGGMLIIAPCVLLKRGTFYRINIRPEYVYKFAVNFVEKSMYSFIYIGVSVLLIADICFFLVIVLKKRYE